MIRNIRRSASTLAILLVSAGITQAQHLHTHEEGRDVLGAAAAEATAMAAEMTFQEFMNSKFVFKEPFEGGKFIVNGDTPIVDEESLRDFFERILEIAGDFQEGRLAVDLTPDGKKNIWSDTEKSALTYCVSDSFGARKAKVIEATEAAASAWEDAAAVDFIHLTSEDPVCDQFNPNVVFDIRPVDFGAYLARAFFPNEPREKRNVLIDASSFSVSGDLTLAGIMRHELGHTIGLRHEHTRPESGTCFEDDSWLGVTDYDKFSVMHYPQCNGSDDWTLNLTELDKHGSACLYGAAPGFNVDSTVCNELE